MIRIRNSDQIYDGIWGYNALLSMAAVSCVFFPFSPVAFLAAIGTYWTSELHLKIVKDPVESGFDSFDPGFFPEGSYPDPVLKGKDPFYYRNRSMINFLAAIETHWTSGFGQFLPFSPQQELIEQTNLFKA